MRTQHQNHHHNEGVGGEQQAQCRCGAVARLPGHRGQLPGQDGKHPFARCR